MKYFYNCPIEAAFMKKAFKINLTQEKYGIATNQPATMATPVFHRLKGYSQKGYRWVIAPDSIHLLTPARGDLVHASYYHKTNYVYRLVTNVFKDGFEVGGFSRYGFGQAIDGREIHKIIQRNGVAFITPEVDA